MFCRKCGNEIPEDSAFCPKCGESIITDDFMEKPDAVSNSAMMLAKTAEDIFTAAAEQLTSGAGTDVSVKKKSKLKIILFSTGALIAVLTVVFFAVILPEMHPEFYYKRDEDNGCYIIQGAKKDMKEIIIPDTIWFAPVRVVEDEAFMNTDIESVSFGKNIRSIGMNAFRNCLDLKTVKFSNEMQYDNDTGTVTIGGVAFGGCISLQSVRLPNIDTNIYGEAFLGCVKLSDINLGNVNMINFRAFVSCSSINEVNTDAKLGEGAFEDCTSLRNVSLLNTEIPERCFSGCTELETVRCSYNDGTICEGAFENCANLSAFYVDRCDYNTPKNLAENGTIVIDSAFSGCSKFKDPNPTTQHHDVSGTTVVGLTQGEIKRYFNNDYKRTTKMGYVIEFCNGDIFISEQDNDSNVVRSVFLFGEQFLSSDLGKTDFIHVGMTVCEVFEILGEMPLIERNEMEYSVSMEFEMYGYQFILSLSGKSPESIITNAIVQIS